MKIDFIHNIDDRMLGIALLILGGVIYQALHLDFNALVSNASIQDPGLRTAALNNLGVGISTQIFSIATLVLMTVMALRFRTLARRIK